MNKIYLYVVQNLIEELSYLRYTMLNKEEHFEDIIMAAKVGGNIYIASRMKLKPMNKKLKEIFMGETGAIAEFAIFDATPSVMNDDIIIDTTDDEINKLVKIFSDIRRANEMLDIDSIDIGDDHIDDEDFESVYIPDLDELLDKIGEYGINSLNDRERELLSDYSK